MAGERAIATSLSAAGRAPARRAPVPGWLPNWGILSTLLICVGLAVLALYLFSPNWFILDRLLPVGLRSPLQADYSVDPFTMAQPPVDDRIIADVLVDQRTTGEQDPVEMLATLVEPLRSPVPSITPGVDSTPGIVVTSTPSAAPTEVPPPTATRTAAAATATPTMTRTVTATRTASATAIPYQPSPTSGTIHTPTRILPTATTRPASTATRAATATTAVTATAVPTSVPPTKTPLPPATATPRPPATATHQPYPPPGNSTPPAYP